MPRLAPLVRLAHVALAAAALASGGCGAGGGAADMARPPGVIGVELGGITDVLDPGSAWVPFTDGQQSTLTYGAQGGFHVWMKARLVGGVPGRLVMSKQARRVSDEKLVLRAMSTIEPDATRTDAGAWEMPQATPMFMCPSPIGISVIDEKIRFELTFTDEVGKELGHGEVTLVPRCPTDSVDGMLFCQRICTG